MKKQPIFLDIPPPALPFEGYTKATFKFLHHLKNNNNKLWFDANRSEYETVLREPSKTLVTAMASIFAAEDIPLVADLRRSLFRINRDIRFSKNKAPYKTHIGIVFGLNNLADEEWAGMYMGMEPKGMADISCYFGGGAYGPTPQFLKAIRTRIANNYKRFEQLNTAKTFRKEFPAGITGASLIRMPKGFAEDHPASQWLKLKEFLYNSPLTKADLTNVDLPNILLQKIEVATPMLLFLAGRDQ